MGSKIKTQFAEFIKNYYPDSKMPMSYKPAEMKTRWVLATKQAENERPVRYMESEDGCTMTFVSVLKVEGKAFFRMRAMTKYVRTSDYILPRYEWEQTDIKSDELFIVQDATCTDKAWNDDLKKSSSMFDDSLFGNDEDMDFMESVIKGNTDAAGGKTNKKEVIVPEKMYHEVVVQSN